jgi:hypothetical protein
MKRRAEQREDSGVEWSRVEWSGVEWSGVEWSGVEWFASNTFCQEREQKVSFYPNLTQFTTSVLCMCLFIILLLLSEKREEERRHFSHVWMCVCVFVSESSLLETTSFGFMTTNQQQEHTSNTIILHHLRGRKKEQIEEQLKAFGKIVYCQVLNSADFAIVTFESPQSAKSVIENMLDETVFFVQV